MANFWIFLLAAVPLALTPSPPKGPSPTCFGCRADLKQIRSGYTVAEWKALARGDIVTSKRETGANESLEGSLESSAIIPRRSAEVWGVLADFESRPEFTPGLEEVHVVRTEGDRVWLKERVKVWWFSVRYQIIGTLKPALGAMTWVLDKSAPHDIADSRGSWQLAPLPDGERTLIRYRAHIDTGKPVPHFVEAFLTKRSLPKIVGTLRTEVKRRFPR